MVRVLALVIQKVDYSIYQINHYPEESSLVCFVNTCPLDSDLFHGECCPTFN